MHSIYYFKIVTTCKCPHSTPLENIMKPPNMCTMVGITMIGPAANVEKVCFIGYAHI